VLYIIMLQGLKTVTVILTLTLNLYLNLNPTLTLINASRENTLKAPRLKKLVLLLAT